MYTATKPQENKFNSFYHSFEDFFSAFIDKLSECRILKVNNPWQNDFISGKSTQLKQAFNFPFNFIYGQPVTRSRIWEI